MQKRTKKEGWATINLLTILKFLGAAFWTLLGPSIHKQTLQTDPLYIPLENQLGEFVYR